MTQKQMSKLLPKGFKGMHARRTLRSLGLASFVWLTQFTRIFRSVRFFSWSFFFGVSCMVREGRRTAFNELREFRA